MERPKLRKLERHRLDRDGEVLIVLRDPLGVSEPVGLPEAAAPILDLLDGQRTPKQLRQSLLFRGEAFDRDELAELLEDLSDAGLLDDDAFRRRWRAMLDAFLESPRRPPRFGDVLYPGDPSALREFLDARLGDPAARRTRGSDLAGLVVPHQPLGRSAALLDRTLRDLPEADELDLVVVLGTDHHPGLTPYTATDKIFDTPLGPVASDVALVGSLGRRIEWLRREEIRHREALSVELAAIYLRYLYGDASPPILPLLCGHSALLVGDASAAADDFQAHLGDLSDDPRVLWLAVAELGHCGPAYGRPPLTDETAEQLQARDRGLLEALARGQVHELHRRCLGEDPQLGPPSGAAVLTTLARLLPVGYRGDISTYEVLPAPGGEAGLVGLAGVALRRPR
ncbi:MAG: AmmeMemoRadiSam system protein B [Myxococcales bacterium]|nr:AmmeMemoRadiSam system protein B [Myxococcales bacterium]